MPAQREMHLTVRGVGYNCENRRIESTSKGRRACTSLRRSRTERYWKNGRQEPCKARVLRTESVRGWRCESSGLLGKPISRKFLFCKQLKIKGGIF